LGIGDGACFSLILALGFFGVGLRINSGDGIGIYTALAGGGGSFSDVLEMTEDGDWTIYIKTECEFLR
jgi:hypothetical protein